MTTGAKIRTLRLHNNWTQKHLASLLGVSETTIRNYELGKGGIRPTYLHRLAEIFGVDKAFLAPERSEDRPMQFTHLLSQLHEQYGLRFVPASEASSLDCTFVAYFTDPTAKKLFEEAAKATKEESALELSFFAAHENRFVDTKRNRASKTSR